MNTVTLALCLTACIGSVLSAGYGSGSSSMRCQPLVNMACRGGAHTKSCQNAYRDCPGYRPNYGRTPSFSSSSSTFPTTTDAEENVATSTTTLPTTSTIDPTTSSTDATTSTTDPTTSTTEVYTTPEEYYSSSSTTTHANNIGQPYDPYGGGRFRGPSNFGGRSRGHAGGKSKKHSKKGGKKGSKKDHHDNGGGHRTIVIHAPTPAPAPAPAPVPYNQPRNNGLLGGFNIGGLFNRGNRYSNSGSGGLFGGMLG